MSNVEVYTPPQHVTGSDEVATTAVTVKQGQTLAALTPLELDANGEAVAAVPANAKHTFLTVTAVDTTAAAKESQVYKSGTFDPEQVSWSTETAAQKLAAFAGTPISLQKFG